VRWTEDAVGAVKCVIALRLGAGEFTLCDKGRSQGGGGDEGDRMVRPQHSTGTLKCVLTSGALGVRAIRSAACPADLGRCGYEGRC